MSGLAGEHIAVQRMLHDCFPANSTQKTSLLQYRSTFEHGESLVLVLLHDLALARTLVVDAAQVQDAVNDDTMQLVVVGLAELLGIGAHSIERDDNIAVDDIALIVIEGDDIGVIIMAQILVVDLENLLVVYKHVAHLAHFASV